VSGRESTAEHTFQAMRALVAAVSLALLVVASCNLGPGPAAPSSTAPACMHDEDCQIGACGPCDVSTPIGSASLTQACAVNPCPGARAYCTPANTCAVR